MPDIIAANVRRIDLEPKQDYLGPRTYAHIFLAPTDGGKEVDVYTDNPRFEAVFFSAFSAALPVEVTFEEIKESGAKKVVRIAVERKAA